MATAPASSGSGSALKTVLIVFAVIGLFGLLCVGGCAGCIACTAAVAVSAIVNHPAYQQALAQVQASPEVIEKLGQPVEASGIPQGDFETTNGEGSASFAFNVKGPRGEATVGCDATQTGGVWTLETLSVTFLTDYSTIDLLSAEVDLSSPADQDADDGGDGDPPAESR